MREFKFRGKNIDTKEWVYGDLIQRVGFMPTIIHSVCDNGKIAYIETSVQSESVGQFTGMYDVNGKEIYEGDIVEKFSSIAYDRCQIDSGIRGVVIFLYGAFRFFENGNFILEDKPSLHQEYTTYKLIGNIDDNLELIKL